MALRGKKPEAVQKRLKALFFGAAGVGKTMAAIQFPKPYLIDTERGAENDQYTKILSDQGGVIFQTSDFNEMVSEVKALLSEKHEYRTLIIDPLTTVYNDVVDRAAAEIRANSRDRSATGTEFGRHYSEANRRTRYLLGLLTRLDMNVIITSHAKDKYGNDMQVLGTTFDCYRKLDYLFDLVFEVQKRGKERVGIVTKTRVESFPEGEQFPFNYSTLADRYGREILEREAKPEILATKEQVKEIKRLIEAMNIAEETYQKWLDKAGSESWEEMPMEIIQKCIDSLLKKINKEE